MIFLMHECEEKLGYTFNDKNLLRQCFTHSSCSNENKELPNNERLEFFGDSILGYVVAEYLMSKEKKLREGELTAMKIQIVSSEPLCKAIKDCGLDEYVLYGEGEKNNHNGSRDKTYENLFEALVAGIYIDGGLEEAKKFIFGKLIGKTATVRTKAVKNVNSVTDPKSKLQEYFQKKHKGTPEYRELEKTGPAHEPIFRMAVYMGDEKLAEATGKSKHTGEKECARIALENLLKRGNK